ncbi:MAG: DNA repair protein RadC [Candidatus Doudnabacteria bacterium]
MSFTIRDLPAVDRPRERLRNFGAPALSLQELLDVIIGHGGVNSGSVLNITQEIFSKYQTLGELNDASINDLRAIKGLGIVKAIQIKAAFELGKRLQIEYIQPKSGNIFNSKDAFLLSEKYLKKEKKEHLLLFCLDSRSRLICNPLTLSIGTLDASLLHPREIFVTAIKNYSSRIILAHNHPSGSSVPSPADLEVTEQVIKAGKIVGIPLIDHIVVGNREYTSIGQHSPILFS